MCVPVPAGWRTSPTGCAVTRGRETVGACVDDTQSPPRSRPDSSTTRKSTRRASASKRSTVPSCRGLGQERDGAEHCSRPDSQGRRRKVGQERNRRLSMSCEHEPRRSLPPLDVRTGTNVPRAMCRGRAHRRPSDLLHIPCPAFRIFSLCARPVGRSVRRRTDRSTQSYYVGSRQTLPRRTTSPPQRCRRSRTVRHRTGRKRQRAQETT